MHPSSRRTPPERALVAVLALAALGLACHPTEEPPLPNPDLGERVALESYPRKLAEARCALERRCGVLAAHLVDACLEFQAAQLGDDPRKAVESGTAHYDEDAAASCVADYAVVRCPDAATREIEPRSCARVFAGQLPAGSGCHVSAQCADGFCDASGQACPGTCVAYRHEGEACAAGSAPCDPRSWLYCDAASGTCKTTEGSVGNGCTVHADCGLGLACAGSSKTCIVPMGEGEPCSTDGECAAGYSCRQEDGTGGPHCHRDATEGEACRSVYSDGPLFGTTCGTGLLCKGGDPYNDVPGTCTPGAELGGECVQQTGPKGQPVVSGCRTGLQCVNGRCEQGTAPWPYTCGTGSCFAPFACVQNVCQVPGCHLP